MFKLVLLLSFIYQVCAFVYIAAIDQFATAVCGVKPSWGGHALSVIRWHFSYCGVHRTFAMLKLFYGMTFSQAFPVAPGFLLHDASRSSWHHAVPTRQSFWTCGAMEAASRMFLLLLSLSTAKIPPPGWNYHGNHPLICGEISTRSMMVFRRSAAVRWKCGHFIVLNNEDVPQ